MTDYSLKKIIFADVDDTVCPSTQPVGLEMAAELNRLIGLGRVLAFISGSTVAQLWGQLGGALRGEYDLLGTSGTAYAHANNGKLKEIYHFALPLEERTKVVEVMRQFARRHALQSLTTEDDQIQDRGSQITFSAIGRHAPEALKRSFDPFGQMRAVWALELKKALGDAYSITVGGTTSIDVTHAGLDKGWGLREFLKFRGLKATDAVYFGDKLHEGGNDYPARAVMDCIEIKNLEDTLNQLRRLA